MKVETGIEANKLKTEVNVDIKAIKQAKEEISSKLKGESRKLKVKTEQSHPGEGKMASMFPISPRQGSLPSYLHKSYVEL